MQTQLSPIWITRASQLCIPAHNVRPKNTILQKNYPHFGCQNRFFYLIYFLHDSLFRLLDLRPMTYGFFSGSWHLISCNPVVLWSRTIRKIKFVFVTWKNIKKIGKRAHLQGATSPPRRLLFKFPFSVCLCFRTFARSQKCLCAEKSFPVFNQFSSPSNIMCCWTSYISPYAFTLFFSGVAWWNWHLQRIWQGDATLLYFLFLFFSQFFYF